MLGDISCKDTAKDSKRILADFFLRLLFSQVSTIYFQLFSGA
jgi:hypothetical protein